MSAGPLVDQVDACMLRPSALLCEAMGLPVAVDGYMVEIGYDERGRPVTQLTDAATGMARWTPGWLPMPPVGGRP